MGKKSRRKKSEGSKDNASTLYPGSAKPPVSLAAISSFTSEASFANPFENEAAPKLGWARELRTAEKELRHNPIAPDVVLRTAKAARAMRQFDRLDKILDKAESRGFAIDGVDDRSLVHEWKLECASNQAQRTIVNDPEMTSLLSKAMNEDMSLDSSTITHSTFSNLSALQYAAFTGDVKLLERIVGLGAALDYVHDEPNEVKRRGAGVLKKPSGATPLLLAVYAALCARQCLEFESEEQWRGVYEGAIECAIQLVRLGANVSVRLQIPTGRDAKSISYVMVKEMKWEGKSVDKLAAETGSDLLVRTIQSLDLVEEKIKLVNCRCGSRMPWRQCHAGKESDPYYQIKGPNSINWRFSPCAPCPCKNTKKIYFKCCWNEPYRENFQADDTAELSVTMHTPVHDGNRDYLIAAAQRMKETPSNFGFDASRDPNDILKMKCEQIMKGGRPLLAKVSQSFHPKSKIGTWDPEVYCGVMQHIGHSQDVVMIDFFQWNDIHWILPKPELLKRVDEWNNALEQYCDSVGLTGLKRGDVIKMHTASPFAPCANLNCKRMETKVKEFSKCSRCLSVAYCSRACSKEDYKFHKIRCIARESR